jgi:four helix bundle protein
MFAGNSGNESQTFRTERLDVYRRLCHLHLDVCTLTRGWPVVERFELGSQVRRSSNSAPAQLAERLSDRHVRNRIEGVNLSRSEASETIHHLYIANLKGYVAAAILEQFRDRYEECIRMLNGLERTLEQQLPPHERRWPAAPRSRRR